MEIYAPHNDYNLRDLFSALRIKQWIKNLIIPAVGFAMLDRNLNNNNEITNIFFGFIAFCIASSCIYILNDIMDAPKDRAHPIKCKRPIASGRIGTSFLFGLLAALCPVSIFIASMANTNIALIVLIYFSINIGYCLKFKHIANIDIICVSSGFTLRALAGAYAVGVTINFWVLAAITFSCMGLAIMKRMTELKSLGSSGETRPVLSVYKYETLLRTHDIFMVLSIQAVIMFFESSTKKFTNQFTVAILLIFISAAFLIFIHKVQDEKNGDPTTLIYRNKYTLILMLLILTTIFLFK